MILFNEIILEEEKIRSNYDLMFYLYEKMNNVEILNNTNVYNLFVHFSDVPKLGIYPSSGYNTPIGIYAYPFQYIWKNFNKQILKQKKEIYKNFNLEMLVPFAGDRKYLISFSVKGNIIQIGKVKIQDVEKYIEDIMNLDSVKKIKSEDLSFLLEKAYDDSKGNYGKLLWFFVINISKELAKIEGKRSSSISNTIFRKIGIDGVIDMGSKTIHRNRPYQAVFFHYNSIRNYELFYNLKNKYVDIEELSDTIISENNTKIIDFIADNKDDFFKLIDLDLNKNVNFITSFSEKILVDLILRYNLYKDLVKNYIFNKNNLIKQMRYDLISFYSFPYFLKAMKKVNLNKEEKEKLFKAVMKRSEEKVVSDNLSLYFRSKNLIPEQESEVK